MIEWFKGLDIELQVTIISSITTILILISKGFFSSIYENYSLRYKMRVEYDFEQRKNIKEQLAKTKTPLIKSAEELNSRLWNLSNYIDEGWHNISENEWIDDKKYYLRSFSYRLISFLFWILKAENSIYSFDLSMADSSEQSYLKQIKTLKHFFCERELLEELGYVAGMHSNHFYKDELATYINFIDKNGDCMNYMDFESKFKSDYSQIEKVIKYISEIKSDPTNLNYNVVKSFHIFLMLFLNQHGLDYHYTEKKKIKNLIKNRYNNLQIKKGLMKFLKRSEVPKEAKTMIEYFELKNKRYKKLSDWLRNSLDLSSINNTN